MIAIDTRSFTTSTTTMHHHLNRRSKRSKNKLHRARGKGSKDGKKAAACKHQHPVPPAESRVRCEKTFRERMHLNYTLLPGLRTVKSDILDKPVKLPQLKKNSLGGEGNFVRERSNISVKSSSCSNSIKTSSKTSCTIKSSSSKHSSYQDLSKSQKTSRSHSQLSLKSRPTSTEDGEKEQIKPKKSKSVYILEAIKPNNVLSEKEKFMRLHGRYNPQFEYDNPASEKVLLSYTQASDKLIPQACKIMDIALRRYGTYEAFEEAIAGRRLTEQEFSAIFKNFVSSEGLQNRVHLNLTPHLLSRAVMTKLRSKPTMNVNSKVLREGWAQGLLQHEIGTHYMRSANNKYQPWHNNRGRKKYNLLPMNPTEEGIASLHSVLGRDDPCLWRSAMLYYTVYQASLLPFSDLFEHLGRYIHSPEVRWDYCMRAKRGQCDTSVPGCFNKDQVYLTGALQILRFRYEIDFHALVKMGRVAYQDVERLRCEAILGDGAVSVPSFMADAEAYTSQLNEIRLKNGLTDKELTEVFPSMTSCR